MREANRWAEVVVTYGETIVEVRHVGRVGDRDYAIGEGPGAAFVVAGATRRLISADGSTLWFTAADDGDVVIAGESVTFAEMVANGWVRADAGGFRWPIAAGGRCRVRRGGATFTVRSVAAEGVRVGRGRVDRTALAYDVGALVVLGGVLLLASHVPDTRGLLALEGAGEAGRFVGYVHRASVLPVLHARTGDTIEVGAASEAAAASTAGRQDMRRATVSLRRRGAGGGGGVVRMDRGFDPERVARTAGVLALIDDAAAGGAGWVTGSEAEDAELWGGAIGAASGEAYAVGGLGLAGMGRGGVGAGEGVIGPGRIALTGKGGGCGADCKAKGGRGRGAGFGGRGSRVPAVRPARAEVAGGLADAEVRRVVRGHLGELRRCYDEALTRDPQARGRVTVELFVGTAGQVSGLVASETTVRDAGLVACTLAAARRWRFPRAERGTLVTHPFVFEPA